MGFIRRKEPAKRPLLGRGGTRDPFEHLQAERDKYEDEEPWFLAGDDDGADIQVQAGVSSNLSADDLDDAADSEPPPAVPASTTEGGPRRNDPLDDLFAGDHPAPPDNETVGAAETPGADTGDAGHHFASGLTGLFDSPGGHDTAPPPADPRYDRAVPLGDAPAGDAPLGDAPVDEIPTGDTGYTPPEPEALETTSSPNRPRHMIWDEIPAPPPDAARPDIPTAGPLTPPVEAAPGPDHPPAPWELQVPPQEGSDIPDDSWAHTGVDSPVPGVSSPESAFGAIPEVVPSPVEPPASVGDATSVFAPPPGPPSGEPTAGQLAVTGDVEARGAGASHLVQGPGIFEPTPAATGADPSPMPDVAPGTEDFRAGHLDISDLFTPPGAASTPTPGRDETGHAEAPSQNGGFLSALDETPMPLGELPEPASAVPEGPGATASEPTTAAAPAPAAEPPPTASPERLEKTLAASFRNLVAQGPPPTPAPPMPAVEDDVTPGGATDSVATGDMATGTPKTESDRVEPRRPRRPPRRPRGF